MNLLYIIAEESFVRVPNYVKKYYIDRLSADDLKDPDLFLESLAALDELTQILKLGSIYKFQI